VASQSGKASDAAGGLAMFLSEYSSASTMLVQSSRSNLRQKYGRRHPAKTIACFSRGEFGLRIRGHGGTRADLMVGERGAGASKS
jgi:hypothetical protein